MCAESIHFHPHQPCRDHYTQGTVMRFIDKLNNGYIQSNIVKCVKLAHYGVGGRPSDYKIANFGVK